MQLLLRKFRADICCLCGSSTNLTGEHKLKASALRDEFGNTSLVIGNFDENNSALRTAQSPKSKKFHFKAKLCQQCNGAKSQAPDRAFDEYNRAVKISLKTNSKQYWNNNIFTPPGFELGSEKSINLLRYFSKILCCRIAESEGPTPIYLAKHAIGEFEQNRVWLRVRKDITQEYFEKELGAWSYAAHGGLIVYCAEKNYKPNAFHSTISFGPVQYVFWFRLHWLEKLEMKLFHTKFYHELIKIGEYSKKHPIPESKRKEFGIDN